MVQNVAVVFSKHLWILWWKICGNKYEGYGTYNDAS